MTTKRAVPVRAPALAALVAELEAAAPELRGRIAVHADRDERMAWPKVGIQVTKMPFRAAQAVVHRRGPNGDVVFDVGHFEAVVQLRLGAPTHAQRVALGDALLGPFLGDEERRGVLVTPIPGCFDAVAAWELGEDGWGDEFAFANKRWSQLVVTGQVPALVRKTGLFTIEDLRVVLSHDMAASSVDEAGTAETWRINEDGTITAL